MTTVEAYANTLMKTVNAASMKTVLSYANTDKIYEKYFSNKYSIEQWQEINHNACQLLKDAYKEETNVQQ